MVKLPALADRLKEASWRSALTHITNSTPLISGTDLISSLIRTHTDVTEVGPGSGGPSNSANVLDAAASSSEPSSYGSVRDATIGDALRAQEAAWALEKAGQLSGVERVEALMQSGSVLLTRAELLQEGFFFCCSFCATMNS